MLKLQKIPPMSWSMLNFTQSLHRSNVQVKGKMKHLTIAVTNQGINCRPSALALKMFLIGTKTDDGRNWIRGREMNGSTCQFSGMPPLLMFSLIGSMTDIKIYKARGIPKWNPINFSSSTAFQEFLTVLIFRERSEEILQTTKIRTKPYYMPI